MIFLILIVLCNGLNGLDVVQECGGGLTESFQYMEFLNRFEEKKASCERFEIFSRNLELVDILNKDKDDLAIYSVERSPFGDWSQDDFVNKILMVDSMKLDKNKYKTFEGVVNKDDDDEGIDWVEKGIVSSVRNQGSLGTCYAFSAAGCVEAQMAKTYGKFNTIVSVEHSLECDNGTDRQDKEAICGEFGGWPFLVFEFWKNGFVKEEDFPYCAGTLNKKTLLPNCFPCMPIHYDKKSCGDHDDLYCNRTTTIGQGSHKLCEDKNWLLSKKLGSVKSWKRLSSNETKLGMQIKEFGPSAVVMNAISLQFYHKGIANPKICPREQKTHAVLIVGYGNEKTQPYYKVQNSWGPKWGENGYFRISKGNNKCGIADFAVVAQV